LQQLKAQKLRQQQQEAAEAAERQQQLAWGQLELARVHYLRSLLLR